ncbi:MAG: hypothetical protein IJC89_00315 [Clostridia bacterium]|nr:hypothetical protein [Clostridia bacterium]
MKRFMSMALVLVILLGIWWVYGKVSVVETRVTAVAGEYEDSFNAKGIIIRNEYPITSSLEGILQNSVQNGTRVSKYANVAYVYSADADKDVIDSLKEVNARIEEISSIQDSTLLSLTDVNEINSKITSFTDIIAKESVGGDNTRITGILDEINILISRKRYLEGESVGENNDLNSLMNKRTELENKLGGKRVALGAPVSGLYFDFTDGYEGVKISDTSSLTIDKIENIQNGKSIGDKTENAVCKIVDNSAWVVSVVMNKDRAKTLAEGQSVQLRFNGDENTPAVAKVDSFVYDGKKVIVNFAGNCYVGNIYSERVCTVDIILNTYRGLKIPADAIINKGDAGNVVLVRKSGGDVEKTVKVLYTPDDGTAIVKAGTQSEELLLYDEVIVKEKRR